MKWLFGMAVSLLALGCEEMDRSYTYDTVLAAKFVCPDACVTMTSSGLGHIENCKPGCLGTVRVLYQAHDDSRRWYEIAGVPR